MFPRSVGNTARTLREIEGRILQPAATVGDVDAVAALSRDEKTLALATDSCVEIFPLPAAPFAPANPVKLCHDLDLERNDEFPMVQAMVFSPDGNEIATGYQNRVTLWRIGPGCADPKECRLWVWPASGSPPPDCRDE